MGQVIIFGSINMDLVVRSTALPLPGETIHGQRFFTAPGGKGANQAVASGRLGVPTKMIGCVGDDVFGGTLRDSLSNNGVDTSGVRPVKDTASGVALITVAENGENTIVLAAGANAAVGEEELDALRQGLARAVPSGVLLLQLEIDLKLVEAAAQMARDAGITVILDPAPAQPVPQGLMQCVTLLTPNESEAAALVGYALSDDEGIKRAAAGLLARGAAQVVIKLGKRGAYWTDGTADAWLQPFPVKAIDTVAAGDAFNGGTAAALALGKPMSEALRWGMATAAISVTREGAQQSMPTRDELDALLQN
jgi:ribokinase